MWRFKMDPIDMIVTDINCEDLGLSRLCLMENAGKCLSDEISTLSTFTFSKPVKIAIFTGSGGNGGDGFVAARHLLNRGFEVEIFMLAKPRDIKSIDAQINFEILQNMVPHISRLNITELNDSTDIEMIEIAKSQNFSEYIIIDGILGTGIKGNLGKKVKKAIEVINRSNALKVSIDVPSGMDPLTGEIEDIAVKPEYTLTFHRVKTGVKKASLTDKSSVGGLIISDIGIPIEAEIFVGSGDLIRLKNRRDDSHKGNNGKILIIGGNKDYHGAPTIAGLSALSSGADLVYIATPKSACLAIKQESPNLIVKGLSGENEDYLSLDNLDEILDIINNHNIDAILMGPGAGLNDETGKLFNILAKKIEIPLVLDADALKLINPTLIKNREDVIITPHFNELNVFFDDFIEDSENLSILDIGGDYDKFNESLSNLQVITRNINGTVILKGKYDIIFKGNKFRINKTGNSGMTVGGTGDSLAGIAASILSQGLDGYNAGSLAAYLNGKAGDLAKEEYGNGFLASHLSEFLGLLME